MDRHFSVLDVWVSINNARKQLTDWIGSSSKTRALTDEIKVFNLQLDVLQDIDSIFRDRLYKDIKLALPY